MTASGDAPLRLVARRSRPLPSGRAVLGGLLVALAVVGTFVAARGGDPAGTRYVVAARPIDAGEVIDPADLTTRQMVLDPAVAARSFTDPTTVAGSVALVPVEPGDLLGASAVRSDGAGGGTRLELTLSIPEGRTPPALRRGERVTVLATLGSGDVAATRPVLDAVEVVDVAADDGLAGLGEVALTVAVTDPAVAVDGAHAARVGELTVVRVQGDAPAFDTTSTADLLTPSQPTAGPEPTG